MSDEFDNIDAFENQATAHKLPLGWLILFFGLIIWGLYYFWAYSPALGGWSQEKAYLESTEKAPAE